MSAANFLGIQIVHISPRTQEMAKVAEQKLLRRVDLGGLVEFSEWNSKEFFFQKFQKKKKISQKIGGGHVEQLWSYYAYFPNKFWYIRKTQTFGSKTSHSRGV